MATVQTSAPAVEPIALADAKAFLRIDTPDEDALIQSLIMTSRLHIEVALGLALIQQTWSCFFDRWPPVLDLRSGPLQVGNPVGLVLRDAGITIESSGHPGLKPGPLGSKLLDLRQRPIMRTPQGHELGRNLAREAAPAAGQSTLKIIYRCQR